MSQDPHAAAPKWTPRLSQEDIRQLYVRDAEGRSLTVEVDPVGARLLARCESLLDANAAVRGNVRCPQCGVVTEHSTKGDTELSCSECSWASTWGSYRQSLKGQNLRLGNLRSVVQQFIDGYDGLNKPGERLIQIDALLHQFHHKDEVPGEIFATSLLEGKEKDIERLLETLTYGEQSTPELVQTRDRFRETLSQREELKKQAKEASRESRRKQRDKIRKRSDAVEAVGPPAPDPTPRVPQRQIAQLYDLDTKGIYDEDLVNKVGYHLLARVGSIMIVTRTYGGQVKCPLCPKVVEAHLLAETPITCDCGWVSMGFAIREFYKGRRLNAGGMEPYYVEFLKSFPLARGYQTKMVLIDQLIHQFHDFMTQLQDGKTLGRSGGANLIAGKDYEVVDFLNGLSYGENSTAGLAAVRQVWRKRLGRDHEEDENGG